MRILLFLFLTAVSASPSAQTFVWTAGGAGDWTTGTNWNNCIEVSPGPPCFHPLSTDHTAILPAGTVVTLDESRFIGALQVEGNAVLRGTGYVGTGVLEISPGRQFSIDAEVGTDAITADASTQIGGTGRLRITDGIATSTALSVGTVECNNSLGETCDLTGSTVTSPALWMTGGGLMLVDGSAASSLDAMRVDARPLGSGGPVPGDITFTGAPATFDLSSVITFDSFGTIDFNGGSASVETVALQSANVDGLRNLADLTVTGEMDWNSGTIETAGVFTVSPGATVLSRGNNHIKGRMEVAGILEWTNLRLTLGSNVNDPTPASGDLVILPEGLFRAYSNSNQVAGPGALVVQGTLQSDASIGPFPFPSFDTVRLVPDSLAIDGGDVRVLAGTLQMNTGIEPGGISINEASILIPTGTMIELFNQDLAIDAATTVRGGGTLGLYGSSSAVSTLTSAADIRVGALEVNSNFDLVDLSAGAVNAGTVTHYAGLLRLPGGAPVRELLVPGINAQVEYEPGGTLRFRTLDVYGKVDFGGADVVVRTLFAFGQGASTTLLDNIRRLTISRRLASGTWGTGTINASQIIIESGAELDLVGGAHTYTGTLRNSGLIRHTGGDLRINGSFFNNGLYLFEAALGDNVEGSGSFTNLGVFERSEAGTEGVVGVPFDNQGTVRLPGGALRFGGPLTNTGTLAGTGTLDLPSPPLVSGIVAPGLSPGVLTIDGSITLATDARLDIEVGGLAVGTEYDQLSATDTGTLGGTLAVTFVDGFVPSPGESYTLVTCATACVGAFDTVDLPLGVVGDVTVSATDVALSITSVGVALSRFEPVGAVVVGPEGGDFRIKYEINNPTGQTVTTQTWTTLTTPGGTTSEVQSAAALTLAPDEAVARATRIVLQAGAADGTYTYRRYVGTQGVDTLAVASYAFDKSASAALATAQASDAVVGEATVTVGETGVTSDAPATVAAAPSASVALPAATTLRAPYPNPAPGRATVAYEVAEAAVVRVAVYDALGREVAVVADGPTEAGRFEVAVDARAWAPGVYVVRLAAGSVVATERLTVVR